MGAKALSKGDAFFFHRGGLQRTLIYIADSEWSLPLDLAAVGGVASYFMVVVR